MVTERPFQPNLKEYQNVISTVRETDLGNPNEIDLYFQLLRDPNNSTHFSAFPDSPQALRDQLTQDGNHGYTAINVLNEPVGFALIQDAEPKQHDHWIAKLVLLSQLQGNRVGGQILDKLLKAGFTTPTSDNRLRTKLTAAVIMGVKDWERPFRLFRSRGFRVVGILENQVDVTTNGITTTHDVVRLEYLKKYWEAVYP